MAAIQFHEWRRHDAVIERFSANDSEVEQKIQQALTLCKDKSAMARKQLDMETGIRRAVEAGRNDKGVADNSWKGLVQRRSTCVT